MSTRTALIVDDEPDILEPILARMDIRVRAAASLAKAKRCLDRETLQLCLTDMRLPDGAGLDLVAHIQARCPTLPVAVITATAIWRRRCGHSRTAPSISSPNRWTSTSCANWCSAPKLGERDRSGDRRVALGSPGIRP